MKRLVLLLATCGAAFAAHAQISITSSSLGYSQNFDALDTTVYSSSGNHGSTNLPNGWFIFEYGSSTTRNGNDYVGDDGSSNSGDTYSYGTRGTTERAFGTLASGSVAPHFGASFVNNTGATITSFTIRYRGEQWRMGTVGRTNLDSLIFYYSTSAASLSDTLASKWTMDTALTLTTPNMSATTQILDGNAAGNNTIRMATINMAIASGDTLTIRWSDPNITGSDDGMAIDSFSIQFTMANSNRPSLVSHTPLSNAVGVPMNTTLTMTFDKEITAGAGNIYLTNETTGGTMTIPVNSASVAISGNTATVTPSGGLTPWGSVYHVTFDSTAFDTASFNSYGLYDTTVWKFTVNPESVGSFRAGALPLQAVNPAANGSFELSCVLGRAAMLNARVIDLNGRVVAAQSFRAQQGENRFRIRAALPAGTYIIRVDDGNDWGSVKAVLR